MKSSLLFSIYFIKIFFFMIGNVKGIASGMNAARGQFTYHVSLLIHDKLACGGATITSQFILSAAQCIIDESGNFLNVKISVVTGIIHFDSPSRITRKVIRAYVPYEFRRSNQGRSSNSLETGDITILKLKEHLPYFSHILLPKPTKRDKHGDRYHLYTKRTAELTGFGSDIPTTLKSASNLENLHTRLHSHKNLMFVEATTYHSQLCKLSYPQLRDAHLCARAYHPLISVYASGACHGDIGGPLVIEGGIVIGVLSSYIDDCDERYKPALYTRVTSFMSFINDALEDTQTSDIRIVDYTGENISEKVHSSRMSDFVSSKTLKLSKN